MTPGAGGGRHDEQIPAAAIPPAPTCEHPYAGVDVPALSPADRIALDEYDGHLCASCAALMYDALNADVRASSTPSGSAASCPGPRPCRTRRRTLRGAGGAAAARASDRAAGDRWRPARGA